MFIGISSDVILNSYILMVINVNEHLVFYANQKSMLMVLNHMQHKMLLFTSTLSEYRFFFQQAGPTHIR